MSFDRTLLQRYSDWFSRPDGYNKRENSVEQLDNQSERRNEDIEWRPPLPDEIIQSIELSDRESSSDSAYEDDDESDSSTDSNISMLGCLRVKMPPISRKDAPMKKKPAAKSRKAEDFNTCASSKRPKPQLSESNGRASKLQKTQKSDVSANMAKNRRKEVTTPKNKDKGPSLACSRDVISLLSDEDDDDDGVRDEHSFGFGTTAIKTDASKPLPHKILDACDSTTTVEEAQETSIHERKTKCSEINTLRAELQQYRASLNVQTSRADKAEAEVTKLNLWRSAFCEQVQHEKRVAEISTRHMKEMAEQKFADLQNTQLRTVNQLIEENKKIKNDRDQIQSIYEEFYGQSIIMGIEREKLRRELEAEQKKNANTAALEAEHAKLREELEAEQEKNANAAALESEHAKLREELDSVKNTDIPKLQAENARLRSDLEEARKHHTSLMQQLDTTGSQLRTDIAATNTLLIKSPTPSDLEQRSENVRKAFLKAKRQYDSLFSIARNITASTRGIALGSFGEFGKYLRQLRIATEEGERNEEGKECGAPKEGSDESGVKGLK